MERMTYRDIVRTYADGVESGRFDTDLSPRARKLTAVLLRTASNDGRATHEYASLTESQRADIIGAWADTLWNGNVRALAQASGPAVDAAMTVAIERANTILRGV